MAVNLVLRGPVPAPAPQLRVVWQGFRDGDLVEARWVDAAGRLNRWSGSSDLPWLQRDTLQAGEEWRVNLAGVPGDVAALTLAMSVNLTRTVGVMARQLTGDPNMAVVHPGAELPSGAAVELLEFRRAGGGWQVIALNNPVGEAPSVPQPPQPAPGQPGQRFSGWSGPVSDGPAPSVGPAAPRAGVPTGPTPSAGGRPPVGDPVMSGGNSTPAAAPWTGPVDDGPRIPIPDRLAHAVDAARSTGKTRRVRVTAVVDLSASMYPWIASGAVADTLTAVQAVAGAAHRPSVATRFWPDDVDLDLPLDAEPATALQTHLRSAGLRTGDRTKLLQSLIHPAADTVTLVVTDDVSLTREPGIAGATTIMLTADPRSTAGAPDPAAGAVFVPAGPVDVNRLARDIADRCFTTARR